MRPVASSDHRGGASELLESGAAVIILKEYNDSVRETLQMAGAEAV
jgi:hypothetical protein